MKLVLINRKRRKYNNFSIESIFDNLSIKLNENFINVECWSSPYLSNGFVARIKNMVFLFLKSQKSCADIFHVTGDVHFLILALPCRVSILTVHDLMLLDGLKGIKRYLYKLFWFQLPLTFASAVTTVSETTRLNLEKQFPKFKQKIRVLPPIVDSHFKRFDKVFKIDCPKILLIGTSKNKNLERVLEATLGLNLHLIIVGNIHLDDYPQLNSQLYTIFTNLNIENLVSKYNDSDIVCCCSTAEGFGLPIIEAQVVGRPVLTSYCSSMPEVAGAGALFVDPHSINDIRNGIIRLMSDSELRNRIVEAGFVNSEKYNHLLVAKQYISLYNEIANKV